MDKFICIHGHFYQPPRENPWLEAIEVQDSAYPYHDWNEKITAECYAPNTASRILNPDKSIARIVNNYARISFNFGPTLLAWMEKKAPVTYRAILEADRLSRQHFSGHASALAQVYNHPIMPLASERDKRTQVIWGIRDFEHRFGRKPEGMWLAETAVDLSTLETLAAFGIKFTILAPGQAGRVRRIGAKRWRDVSGGRVDPKMPYLCRLPSGGAIAIFFYDGPISRDVAFGSLLDNGERFAGRLLGAFTDNGDRPQLVSVATDGETYGHHRRFGDMALTYCLHHIESRELARLTVYGEYLEKHPPEREVAIYENSSWSCAHGIERWRNDCGCHTGNHYDWNQRWRAPLREGMDWLRNKLTKIYERGVSPFFSNPWNARDEYISVILDRSEQNVDGFLNRMAGRDLSLPEQEKALKLLEMQRHALLMYTSCGWFFDEISGIETVQVIQYAARAIQLARQTSGEDLEKGYLEIIARAQSNIEEFGNGSRVYELFVKPAILDLRRVGAHYAISSLFEEYPATIRLYAYTARSEDYERIVAGKRKLATGLVRVRSGITREELDLAFSVLQPGDHSLIGAVRQGCDEKEWLSKRKEIKAVFRKNDLPETIRSIDRYFGEHNYSLRHLFRDEQRSVTAKILKAVLKEIDASFRQIYKQHYPIIEVLKSAHFPLPRTLAVLEEFIISDDLRRELEAAEIDLEHLKDLAEKIKNQSLQVDKVTLGFIVKKRLEAMMGKLSENPDDFSLLQEITEFIRIVAGLPLETDLWGTQNFYYQLGEKICPEQRSLAEGGNGDARKWLSSFCRLGNYLKVKCP